MRCPICFCEDTGVKDSRPTEDGSAIRRRRFCTACGSRFTTFERIQLRDLVVVKKDSSREFFDRDKLARSIFTALRKRPIQTEVAERMITDLVRRLEALGEAEISSQTIGEMVMEALIHLDPVSYVRFASVYRAFKDVEDFEKFLAKFAAEKTLADRNSKEINQEKAS